jgi:hypothetical protein
MTSERGAIFKLKPGCKKRKERYLQNPNRDVKSEQERRRSLSSPNRDVNERTGKAPQSFKTPNRDVTSDRGGLEEAKL